MTFTEALHRVRKLEQAVTSHSSRLSTLKSPTEVYHEKAAEIRERIRLSWASLDSTLGMETSKLRDDIVESGGQLRELEIEHQGGVQDEEDAYEKAVEEISDSLCSELLDILGPARIRSYLQNTSNEDPELDVPEEDSERSPLSSTIVCAGTKRKRESPRTPRTKALKGSQVEGNDHSPDRDISSTSSSDAKPQRRRTRPSHRRHVDNKSSLDEHLEGITEPDAGSIYLAFWEKSKDWFAVLLLPMQNLQNVGISGSIESLGLTEALPKCYCKSRGSFSWKEGYGDGEPLVAEREFPVMYFDGQEFPTKSDVGWVSARNLRNFDATSMTSLIPHVRSVRKFLETREQAHLPESKEDKSGSDVPDATEQLCAEDDHKSPTSLEVTVIPCRSKKSDFNRDQEDLDPLTAAKSSPPSLHCVPASENANQLQPPISLHKPSKKEDRRDTAEDPAPPREKDQTINEHGDIPESESTARAKTTRETDQNSDPLRISGVFEPRKGFRDVIWTPISTSREPCSAYPAPELLDPMEVHSIDPVSSSPYRPSISSSAPTLSASRKVQEWQSSLLPDEDHSSSSQGGAPCDSTALGSTTRLPTISFLLEPEGQRHPPSVNLTQGLSQGNQKSSYQSTSVWTTTKPVPRPPPSRPLQLDLFTTTRTTQSPVAQTLPIHHSHDVSYQRRHVNSYSAEVAPSSNIENKNYLNDTGVQASGSQDHWSRHAFHSLRVTQPNSGWYQDFPKDLIKCLEEYQRHNNLSYGIDGFRVQKVWYMCPFCNDSIRKPYTRPKPFSTHMKSHWATKALGMPRMYNISNGIL